MGVQTYEPGHSGWTHFRPINPPPPSSAKGETKP